MEISDMNLLHEAFLKSMNGSSWKEEPQRFEIDFLSELTKLSDELEEKTYKTSKGSEFTLNERGHIRHIHGGRMRDRVVRHALCDNVLTPKLAPYLIYNNGASQSGKGVDFARRAIEKDLHNYWLEHRTNDGYIGFVDFSKFYDNIRHDVVRKAIDPKVDEDSRWLLSEILDSFMIDVSYMTDEEYEKCLETKFNSIDYYNTVSPDKKTGDKFMAKSVDIGDQVSQNIGIFIPTPVDNYVTAVRGFKRYGRYMDDMYLIHESGEYIKDTIDGIRKEASAIGLYVNEKKTHISRLSDTFTYLQRKYSLTATGRVIRKIHPKAVTRRRRKLKAYKRKCDSGDIPYEDIEQSSRSWMGAYAKVMSKKQIKEMKKLYMELFGKELRWK